MYSIKETPGDFLVDEILNQVWLQEPAKYAVFLLKKQSLNTIQVVDMLTKHLRLKPNDIGYAGIKDRHAITTQYISVPVIPGKSDVEQVQKFSVENATLTHVGYSYKHVCTPMIVGNKFTITVKNCDDFTYTPKPRMINYFGEQRFSKNNADIGYALVKKDFKGAVELILAYTEDETKLTYNERQIKAYLADNPTDFIGALRKLPGQTTKFYLHAYQSKLWNQTISLLLKQKKVSGYTEDQIYAFIPERVPDEFPSKVPAIGFFYDEDDWDKQTQDAINSLFKRDTITERDFVIKQMSEVTEPGAVRNTISPIKELRVISQSNDEITLSFILERGCYATMALRHLLRKN